MDIFTLGLKADTRDLKKGEGDLDRFAKKGAETERKVDKSAARMTASIRALKQATQAAAMAMKATAAVGALFGAAVLKATIEQEKAVRQLEQALESTAGVVGRTSKELRDHAAALQQVTTFGDEAIISMQSMLLTFTNIRGEGFERTTEAALDLATRMGGDLKGAAVQLGKALNDPIANLSALSRSGIQFSDDQKAVIKSLVETNQLAKAQGIILDELSVQFGGSARAARDTLGGAFAALKNAAGDLLEGDGGSLTEIKGSIEELTGILSDPSTVEGVQTFVGSMIGGFAAVTKAVSTTANVVKFLSESLAAFFNGPASGDIVRIQDEIASQEERLQDLRSRRGRGNAVQEIAETTRELAKLRDMERDYFQAAEDAASASKKAADANQGLANSTVNVNVALTDTPAAAKAAAKEIEGLADAQREWELRMNGALQQATGTQGALLEITDAHRRAAERIEGIYFDISRAIVDDFDHVGDAILDSFKQLLINMALEAGRNQILIPLVAEIGGMLGFGQDALAGTIKELATGKLAEQFGDASGKAILDNAKGIGGEMGAAAGPLIGAAIGNAVAFHVGSALGENIGLDGTASGAASVLAPQLALVNLALLNLSDLRGAVNGITGGALGGEQSVRNRGIRTEFGLGSGRGVSADQTYQVRTSGGLFDGSEYSGTMFERSNEVSQQLSRLFGPVFEQASAAAQVFGADISDFSLILNESVEGLDDSEVANLITGMFTQASEALINDVLPGIEQFQRGAETLQQTLARLVDNTTAFSVGMERIGVGLTTTTRSFLGREREIQLTGSALAGAATAMVDAVGGVSQFNNAVDSLIGFADESTQDAILSGDVTRALGDMAAVLPETREEFFELFRTLGMDAQATVLANIDLLDRYYTGLEETEQQALRAAEATEASAEAQRLAAEASLEAQRAAATQFDVALGFADGLDPLRNALVSLGLTMAGLEGAAQSGQAGLQSYLSGLDQAGRALLAPFSSDILGLIPQQSTPSAASTPSFSSAPRSTAATASRGTDWAAIARDLREFARTARTSLLDPVQNLASAQVDFFRTANKARAKDEEAARELAGKGQDVIDMALQTARTEVEFNRIVAQVANATEGVAGALSPEEKQIELMQDQLDTLRAIQFELQSAPGFDNGGLASGPQSGYTAKLHGTEMVVSQNRSVPVTVQNGGESRMEVRMQNIENALYQIAKFNMKSNRVLERWDGDGLPEERTVA